MNNPLRALMRRAPQKQTEQQGQPVMGMELNQTSAPAVMGMNSSANPHGGLSGMPFIDIGAKAVEAGNGKAFESGTNYGGAGVMRLLQNPAANFGGDGRELGSTGFPIRSFDNPSEQEPPVMQLLTPQSGFNAGMKSNQPAFGFPEFGSDPRRATRIHPVTSGTLAGYEPDFDVMDMSNGGKRATVGSGQPTNQQNVMGLNQPSPKMMGLLEPTDEERAYQALIERGPTQHQSSGGWRGFGERVKDFAMAAAINAHEAPQDEKGLAMLGGGVAAAFNPDVAHNLKYQAGELPQAKSRAVASREVIDAERERKIDYGKVMGMIPGEGFTVAGRNAARQQQEFALSQEKFAADQQRHAADQQRQLDTQSLARFQHFTSAAKSGTPIPQDLADAAGLPSLAGQPVTKGNNGVHYVKGKDGTTYELRDGVGFVVKDEKGAPILQSIPAEPREPQTPQYVYEGRAETELAREMGIKDPSALVPNPAYEREVQLEKEADAAAAAQYHFAPSSEAEIRARVAKKTPSQIRAGELITPEMRRARAAQIYERENSGRRSTAPSSQPATPNTAKLQADEKWYQSNSAGMTPEDRTEYENEFKKQYGRLPRKP